MPKKRMSNFLQTSFDQIELEYKDRGYVVSRESTTKNECMLLDENFPELIVVPSIFFDQLDAYPLVTQDRLIFQDEASMYAPKQLINSLFSTYSKVETLNMHAASVGIVRPTSRNSLNLPKTWRSSRTHSSHLNRAKVPASNLRSPVLKHSNYLPSSISSASND
jgi:hypothetical protein